MTPIRDVLPQQTSRVALTEDDEVVEQLSAQRADDALAVVFCHGERGAESTWSIVPTEYSERARDLFHVDVEAQCSPCNQSKLGQPLTVVLLNQRDANDPRDVV